MSETTEEQDIKNFALSAHMIEALTYTPLEGIMAAGPTRAALIRRGLVMNQVQSCGRFGYLTETGRELALKLRACK